MCSIDLEPCEVWAETPVRAARKEHRCTSCRGLIARGAPYVRHFSVFEGDVTTGRVCGPCRDARAEFARVHGMIGVPGTFPDALRDCFGGESREHWTDEDRRWRSLYAGILLRGRAAKRSEAGA